MFWASWSSPVFYANTHAVAKDIRWKQHLTGGLFFERCLFWIVGSIISLPERRTRFRQNGAARIGSAVGKPPLLEPPYGRDQSSPAKPGTARRSPSFETTTQNRDSGQWRQICISGTCIGRPWRRRSAQIRPCSYAAALSKSLRLRFATRVQRTEPKQNQTNDAAPAAVEFADGGDAVGLEKSRQTASGESFCRTLRRVSARRG